MRSRCGELIDPDGKLGEALVAECAKRIAHLGKRRTNPLVDAASTLMAGWQVGEQTASAHVRVFRAVHNPPEAVHQ